MPSQLLTNEGISFVACKPFTYRGTQYSMGDDFPQEEANNIETLVRSRYVIPVLEEGFLKPRHWHKHIRTREQADEYLNRTRVQLRMPQEPDSDEVVNITQLTHPHTIEEPEGEGESALPPEKEITALEPAEEPAAEEDAEGEFNPSDHTVAEVQAYLEAHPEDEQRVIDLEAGDKARKSLVEFEDEEDPGEFDPTEHTVSEVEDYLDEHPEEAGRVRAIEAANRGRKGILEE